MLSGRMHFVASILNRLSTHPVLTLMPFFDILSCLRQFYKKMLPVQHNNPANSNLQSNDQMLIILLLCELNGI